MLSFLIGHMSLLIGNFAHMGCTALDWNSWLVPNFDCSAPADSTCKPDKRTHVTRISSSLEGGMSMVFVGFLMWLGHWLLLLLAALQL